MVEAGDYAVRGGLVDVFPSGAEQPVRLDFFGSTLESIRSFDPLTQRSQGKVDGARADAGERGAARRRRRSSAFKAGYLRQFGAVTGDPLLEAVEAGRSFPGMEHWLPLFHPDLVPLTAYLDARGRDRRSTIWRATRSRPGRR